MEIPKQLQWLETREDGRRWLAKLPSIIGVLKEAWELEIDTPYKSGNVSFVAPARRGANEFVLKVQWPHEECMFEADALKLWNGNGAARLIEHDRENHALLMERCVPGITLADSEDADPIGIAASVVQKLWVPASEPFKHIKGEAKDWHALLSANADKMAHIGEHKIIDVALDYLNELPKDLGEIVLTHQDLHGLNIISSERDGFLAIDPKPLLAEREFSLAPIIRSAELGHSEKDVMYRLDRLTSDLDLDRQKVAAWTIAQTMAWSVSSPHPKIHFEVSSWLHSA